MNKHGTFLRTGMIILSGIVIPYAHGQEIIPPKVDTVSPQGISMIDGSFTYRQVDLSAGNLQLERFYQGGPRDSHTLFFGLGASHNFDIFVARNVRPAVPTAPLPRRYRPIVHLGNSSYGTYCQDDYVNAPVSACTDDSGLGKLEYLSGAYRFTSHEGVIYDFSASVPARGAASDSQRVSSAIYPDGRRLDFSYVSGNLKLITDSSGYALVFDYSSDNLVTKACIFNTSSQYVSTSTTCSTAVNKAQYGYVSGKLSSVTDVKGGITSYGYSSTNQISCVTPPGYQQCKISNTFETGTDTPYSIVQQQLADGSVWNYYVSTSSRARDPFNIPASGANGGVTVTEPTGGTRGYGFAATSPTRFTDGFGNTTTFRFTGGYDSDWDLLDGPPRGIPYGTMLVEAVMPEGNKYLAEYGGPFHSVSKETLVAKPGTGLPDLVKQYGYLQYPSCPGSTAVHICTQPLWIKDAKGNQTDFTYAPHGGVASEMAPAPSAGAPRPLKLYSYVQKYAYVKNSAGGLVPAASAIWLRQTETQCQTAPGSSAPTCDAAAPQVVTTFEYGADGTANNLLVRGQVVSSGGTSLRTCYSYDGYGNRVSETEPRAELGVCS